jgi:glycerol-3-phosphate dehydrogenase
VTGGKLTTFRPIAVDVLREASRINKKIPAPGEDVELFKAIDPDVFTQRIGRSQSRRLCGRYGEGAEEILAAAPELLVEIEGTPYLWAELVWSAKNEGIEHLDDLLLRRFRLGILLPDGVTSLLSRLRPLIQSSLGWGDGRWFDEIGRFERIREIAHAIPDGWRKT